MIRTQEVLVPRSLSEAVDAYGDGDGTLVIAGGTIVMSEINAGRLLPSRALDEREQNTPRREGKWVVFDEDVSVSTVSSTGGEGYVRVDG